MTGRQRRPWVFPALLSMGILLLGACSQTKDNFMNRTGHNLSAHYNAYYNAGLKLDEGMQKLAASANEHYDRVLPVFQYGSPEKAKSVYPQMDDIIKRTSLVIQRHTMYDKNGNEKPSSEKWIDDNWLMYGQAMFFKHEYFQAIDAFKYVEATYKTQPTRHLASMWLAKTSLQLTQLNEAELKLDYLRNVSDFPKKHRWELEATYADFYVQTRNYGKAIDYLQRASLLAPKREDRIRFQYILAQLYQDQGENKRAFDLYTRVLKMNPKYEMDFNARINRARCTDSGSQNTQEVRNELVRLQKDPKNKDYLDQIYYAQAGISKLEGNESDEIDYLNKSVRASTTNANQKAISYLELAKIIYARREYRKAQMYYDSTVTNLPTDHPEYNDILARRNSLTRLIKNLNIIAHEDSMQVLAKMSPADREKLIDEQIAKQEEERRKKEEEQQVNQLFNQGQPSSSATSSGQGSNWYFYNTQAMSFGFNEFTKRWGERKLEDNWRRSNKQSAAPVLETEEKDSLVTESKDLGKGKDAAKKRKDDILKSIPSSPEAIEKSTNKIVEAYYSAGLIYREQINDAVAAAETFEELLQKYPKCKYELQTYYNLFRIYEKSGETAKAEHYKNIILNQFSTTEYAEIIRNPNYATDKANQKSNLEIFYEETYRKYLNGEYAEVIRRKSQAESQFPQNNLMPKFELLRTLSVGRTQPLPQFEASLSDVIRTYPDDPVKDEAQNILDYLHNKGKTGAAPAAPAADSAANKKLYTYLPDTTHFVVIVFQNIGGAIDGAKLKVKLSDFNSKYFGSKGLEISELMFDHRYKLVLVRNFTDKRDAMNYHTTLLDNDEVYGNINPENYQQYPVSVNNYPVLLQQKKFADYEDFFRLFYR